MKKHLLSIALIPLLLTGCAAGGYYSDYPGYYYDPGYYDGPGYAYYDEPVVGLSFYNGGNYRHDYHHYDSSGHHSYASHGSYHSSSTRVAGVSGGGHVSHGSHSASASVSSGSGHRHGF